MNIKTVLILALGGALLWTGCKKDEPKFEEFTGRDAARSNTVLAEAIRLGMAVAYDLEDDNISFLQCEDSVQINTVGDVSTTKIYYPTSSCEDLEGIRRAGVLTVIVNGDLNEEGGSVLIASEDFEYEDFAWDGRVSLANIATTAEGKQVFASNDIRLNLTAPGNDYKTEYSGSITVTRVTGNSTATIVDDEYNISGSGTGLDRAEKSYSVSISSTLVITQVCPWLTQGAISITNSDDKSGSLKFGSGACDSQAELTGTGEVVNITL